MLTALCVLLALGLSLAMPQPAMAMQGHTMQPLCAMCHHCAPARSSTQCCSVDSQPGVVATIATERDAVVLQAAGAAHDAYLAVKIRTAAPAAKASSPPRSPLILRV